MGTLLPTGRYDNENEVQENSTRWVVSVASKPQLVLRGRKVNDRFNAEVLTVSAELFIVAAYFRIQHWK